MNPIERYEAAVKEYAAAQLEYARDLHAGKMHGCPSWDTMCMLQNKMWAAALDLAASRAE